MNRRLATLPFALFALLVPAVVAEASPEAAEGPAAESQSEEGLESWLASLGEPGPHHRVLDSIVGTWEGKGTAWDSADSQPLGITATIERHWVLGGRYLREAVEIRTAGGEVFEALGFIGFNNEAAQYELLTIDNGSTAMLLETGKFNPDTQIMSIRGSSRDPATGFVLDRRVEMDLSQEGRISVVVYITNEEGREYKALEGSVSRRKE